MSKMSLEVHVKDEPLWENAERSDSLPDYQVKSGSTTTAEVQQASASLHFDHGFVKEAFMEVEVECMKIEPEWDDTGTCGVGEAPAPASPDNHTLAGPDNHTPAGPDNHAPRKCLQGGQAGVDVAGAAAEDSDTAATHSYACDSCGQSFPQKHSLIDHIDTHIKDKSKLEYTTDLKPPEIRSEPYACETCNKRYNLLVDLKRHERVHKGEQIFSCTLCNQEFTRMAHLKTHRRLHTGQKPFSCDVCNRTFVVLSNLKIHQRTHTGAKPYSCKACEKCFSHLSSLKKHKLSHAGIKPYLCEVCKKGFSQLSGLKVHKRIHTGEKPYSCEVCEKAFRCSSVLKSHKLLHSGEKPFPCSACGKGFTQLSSLKRHRQTHAKTEVSKGEEQR